MIIAVDLGGVLVDVDSDQLWRMVPSSRRSQVESMLSAHHHGFQSGSLSADAFVRHLSLAADVPSATIESAWSLMVSWRAGAEAALQSWARHHTIELWTNIDILHARALGVDGLHHVMTSYAIGARKPTPAYFEGAVRGRDAGGIWFFDDSPTNVEAALAIGLDARCVRDFEAVSAQL
jgi:FMN phosphatase YigB (HAD superfamily)